MKHLSYFALVLALTLATPAAARPGGGVNPSLSLSAPAKSPLQQQIQQDYATQLMATQRGMLKRNPSGDTPGELAIGHQLNSYTPQ